MKNLKFFYYLLITGLNFLIFYMHFGKFLSIFSFAFSYVLIYCFEIFLFLPLQTIQETTEERINFNLKISGLKQVNYKKIIKLKFLFVNLLLLIAFVNELRPYFSESIFSIAKLFQNTKSFLTVDYQAYQGLSSAVYELSSKTKNIDLDSSSFIKIKLLHIQDKKPWTLSLQDTVDKHTEKFLLQGDSEATQHFVGNTLYKNFNSHPLNLTLTNGKKSFYALLHITPTPLPIVTLTQQQAKFKFKQNTANKLAFSVNVTSKINITHVILALRTQSGFKYEQNLAEFVHSDQKDFDLPYTEVITAGIPFQENDILYIKAIAKTPMLNQNGESNELQFKIQSPTQIRKEIIKNLETALTLLQSAPNFLPDEKSKIQDPLFKAIQFAATINPNGFLVRKISDMSFNIDKIFKKKDEFYKTTESEITSLLKTLKWQVNRQKTQDIIYSIQLFKQRLFSQHEDDKNITQLISKSNELKKTTQEMTEQLIALTKKLNHFLSHAEKEQLDEFFQNDTTAKNLGDTSAHLQKNNLEKSQIETSLAYESAKVNLAGIMRILNLAHKRTQDKQSQEDEENAEREDQEEEDMRNHRSYMETVATQGLLDQSWRKSILDDIARLKKEGNPANSQMIDYLESRLR